LDREVSLFMPAVVRDANPEMILRHMIDDLEGLDAGSDKIHKKLAQSFACRAAIKSGNRLMEEEMAALISDLFRCRNPYVCPHGRPTLIKLSKSELEKRFGR
jgi:DNA mismatch repair protein MutL